LQLNWREKNKHALIWFYVRTVHNLYY